MIKKQLNFSQNVCSFSPPPLLNLSTIIPSQWRHCYKPVRSRVFPQGRFCVVVGRQLAENICSNLTHYVVSRLSTSAGCSCLHRQSIKYSCSTVKSIFIDLFFYQSHHMQHTFTKMFTHKAVHFFCIEVNIMSLMNFTTISICSPVPQSLKISRISGRILQWAHIFLSTNHDSFFL